MSEITYTWKLTSLKKKSTPDVTDAIVQTHWQKIGTDADGNEGTFSGATPFDLNTMNLENFTPFEQLTESQVLGWIQDVVVGDYEEHVNARIQEQIDAIVNPIEDVSEGEFPWSEPTSNTV